MKKLICSPHAFFVVVPLVLVVWSGLAGCACGQQDPPPGKFGTLPAKDKPAPAQSDKAKSWGSTNP